MFYNNLLASSAPLPNMLASAGVEYVRPELVAVIPEYQLIDDAIGGSRRVKARKQVYLPAPQPLTEQEQIARYDNYLLRAVFYNVAGRTHEGLVGRVFTRDPIIEVPRILEPVLEDASGEGVSLDQTAQKCVAAVLAKGRAGVFINYPVMASPASAAQLQTGEVKPSIHIFQGQHVTNWRTFKHLGRDKFSLVVLMEQYTVADDGFASKQAVQYRVLRLVNGVYTQEIWRAQAGQRNGFVLAEGPYVPLNAAGQPYDEIPFRFVGPRESSSEIEKPPMLDICDLNIAHYRNSADYEESVFVTGQPTLWASGLTQDWVTEVLQGEVRLGSRGVLPLPVNGSAGLLQAEPNTLAFGAMEHKEKQMVALGAKLIENRAVQRTATEATADEEAEMSVLSSTARNTSKSLRWALQWCGYFVGIPENSVKYDLNTDFGLSNMTADQRRQLVAEWQAEAITFTEMRASLRRAGIATLTDEEAIRGIESDRMTFAPEVDTTKDPFAPEPAPSNA